MKFWDSSAVIPLVLKQAYSQELLPLRDADDSQMWVWWGTKIECHSAVNRLRRMNAIHAAEEQAAYDLLTEILNVWHEIDPSESLRDEALRLIGKHPLKAADALQLAAALVWADSSPEGEYFVCLDDRLRDAALVEGFSLFPEKLSDF